MDSLKVYNKNSLPPIPYLLPTIYYLLSTILIALLPAISTAEEAIRIPDVVATVNGANITKQNLEDRMNQSRAMDPERFDAMGLEDKKMGIVRTVEDMIGRELVYQEAVNRSIVVSEEDLDLNLEGLKRQFPSGEAFEKAFADARMTIPRWKEETKKNLMAAKLEELLAAELKIPDSEITDYYEKNKKQLNMDAVKVSHILVETEEKAKEVIAEFNKEKDFEGLAKKHSLDAFTKDKGGYLGWYGRGELSKEVEEAAYTLSPGQISGPLKSEHGYHIIRLDEKELAAEQTLEDHREHVRSILQQVRWQKLRASWLNGLMMKAEVEKWAP